MRQRNKEALGRVVLVGHRQLVVVRATARWLTMHVLHYPAQVRAAPGDPPRIGTRAASAEELQLAGMLIDTASQPIDWRNYRDESAEELAALIDAKIAGRPVAAQAEVPIALLPLLDALKKSVAATVATPKPTPSGALKPRQPSRNRRTAG
jgi:non-homologous end joining protein Ku